MRKEKTNENENEETEIKRNEEVEKKGKLNKENVI